MMIEEMNNKARKEAFLEGVKDYLRENLQIKTVTNSVYTGGDPMYEDVQSIELWLEDELISST